MDKILELKNKLAEIQNKIKQFSGADNFTEDDSKQIDSLSAEFETVSKQLDSAEKLAAMNARLESAVPRKAAGVVEIENKVNLKEAQNGGFNNLGELLVSVKNLGTGKGQDRRFQNTMFEKSGEDGGILVPVEFMTTIMKKFESDESLLAKTTQIKVSGNNLTLPIDEQAPWNGGVTAYWTEEGGAITESKSKLGSASWRLVKLAALVKVTDELLEDAVALESYMKAKAPEAMMWKLNSAIISGDGVGKPKGILNSGFKVTVAAEGGQAVDTIVAKNIAKMYSRMIPSSRNKAAWYYNAGCEEQLRVMKDDLGNFIYLAPGSQMNNTPYGLLLGRPCIPMLGSLPALGDEGDIIFADLSYYYSILKSNGIKESVSTHLYFDKDITAFKWTFRIDGSCPFKTPVQTEFGAYTMSGIVTLAAR